MGRSARRGGGVRGGGLSAAAAAAALDRRIAHKDGLGRTRLHKACSKGDCKVALELLQLGADPNARDNALWTPLHEAALNGHSDITRLLLQYGADVNIKGDAGDTALHDACSNGHVDVVKILVNEYKAQVMIGNDTCEKPADVVISPVEEDDEDDVIEKNKARSEILEILLLAGAAPPVSSIDLKQTAADARDAETVSSHSGSTLVTSRTRGNRQSSSTATSTVRQQQQQQQQTTVTTTTTTSRRSARRQQQPVINGNTRRRNARDEDDGMVIADDNDDNVSGSGVDSEGDVSSNGGNSSASDSENESLLSDRTSTNSRRGGKLRHGSSSIASNHSINRSSSNSTHSRRRTAMVDDDEPAGTNYYFTSAEVIPREQRKIMQIAKMIERIENRDARKGQKKGSKPSESQRRSASSRMSRIAAAAAAAGLKPVSAITDRDVDDDNDSDIGNDNGARDDDANISEEPSKSRNQRGDPTIGKRNGGSARSSARASPANSNEKQTASLPSKRSASEFSDRESASASASSKYRRVDSNNNNGAAANSRRTASPVSKRRLIRRGNRGDNDKASDDGVESSNLWSDEADSRKAMPPRKVKLEPDSSSSTTTTAATATTALVNNSGLNSSLERIRGFLPLYTVHLDLSDSNGAARRELFVVDLQIRLMLGMSPFSAPAASGSTSDPLLSRYPKLVRQPVSPSQKNRLWSPFDELMTRVSPSDKTSTADGDWNRPTKPQFCAMPLHFIRLDDLFAIIMTDYPQVCESLNMITVAVDLGYNSSTATGSRSHRSTPEPDSKPVLKAMSNVNLASLSPVKARNIGSVSMPSSPTSIRTTVARLPPKLALKNIQPL